MSFPTESTIYRRQIRSGTSTVGEYVATRELSGFACWYEDYSGSGGCEMLGFVRNQPEAREQALELITGAAAAHVARLNAPQQFRIIDELGHISTYLRCNT